VGNRELDLVIENETFGEAMEKMFALDLTNSTEIVLEPRHRVRPAGGVRVRRPRRAGGSATRAAAGALRIGNAIGSVLAARRVHHPTERWLMGQGAIALLVVAFVGFVWPRVLAWPLGALCLWFALALLARALRRRKRRESAEPDAGLTPSP
jgi:cardiolipin synthase